MLGKTFARNYKDADVTTNSYYIPVSAMTTNQGKQANTITVGENVTGLVISGTPTEYDVSGITAYEGSSGLKYNNKVYAGSADVVNLTLTAAAPEEGYYFHQYTTTAGSVITNSPTSATITMPDGPATVNASFSETVPTIVLADTEDNTGLHKGQKINDNVVYDLSGRRVNGTLQKGFYIVNGKKAVIR